MSCLEGHYIDILINIFIHGKYVHSCSEKNVHINQHFTANDPTSPYLLRWGDVAHNFVNTHKVNKQHFSRKQFLLTMTVRVILYHHRNKRAFLFDSTNFCLATHGLIVTKLDLKYESGLARWKHKNGFREKYNSYWLCEVLNCCISPTKQNKYVHSSNANFGLILHVVLIECILIN